MRKIGCASCQVEPCPKGYNDGGPCPVLKYLARRHIDVSLKKCAHSQNQIFSTEKHNLNYKLKLNLKIKVEHSAFHLSFRSRGLKNFLSAGGNK